MAFGIFLFFVLIFTPIVFGQTITDPSLVLSDVALNYYTTVDYTGSGCFIRGVQCHGNLVSISISADEYECLSACIDNINCNWFQFETQINICYLLENCDSFDQDCPNCIIGSRNCSEMVMLLGLGKDDSSAPHEYRNGFNLVEIDPDNSETYGTYCDSLVDFPETGGFSSGGYAHGKIITCGGILSGNPSKKCYYYSENKWEIFGDLTDAKGYHDSAILPNGNLWVTGGYNVNYHLSSTDIIDQDFNVKQGPELPFTVSDHCIVNWNISHMLLTGGDGGSFRRNTWYFDLQNEIWTPGPSMNYGRYKHGCVSFEDTERNKKVMVIGSKLSSVASSTAELFDGDSWTVLDDLPVGIVYAKTVAYKSKVIVTGQDYSTEDPLPFAWVFDVGTQTWSSDFQMFPPIYAHNSFLVSKSLCK